MTEPYQEKINFLYCSKINNNNPISEYTFNDFPMQYLFKLQALFFNFKVDEKYHVNVLVVNGKGELLIKTKNDFKIDITKIGEDKYTNRSHTNASMLVTLKTPIVNVIGEDVYKFYISVTDEHDKILSEQSTFATIRKDI
ncbi:hypothetical protein [Lactiplantibacillus paraxiangfangensis]|uniref:hypothetical protein n=1 Tax=Lactiplantibacillus paraxiangfangensis TaxID=3076224 RepID=UPI0030C68B3E